MERLRYIREQAGYSQQNLADKSGVSQHTISEIELGRRKPQGRTLRKLANVLNVEVRDFYGEADFPKEGAPPSLEPSFNDVIEERRLSRFASGIASAAEKWLQTIARPETPDAAVDGILEAAARIYGALMDGITRSEWESLTSQERDEFAAVMDKLGNVAAKGVVRLQESGYFDAERTRIQREMMRKWTDRISA